MNAATQISLSPFTVITTKNVATDEPLFGNDFIYGSHQSEMSTKYIQQGARA